MEGVWLFNDAVERLLRILGVTCLDAGSSYTGEGTAGSGLWTGAARIARAGRAGRDAVVSASKTSWPEISEAATDLCESIRPSPVLPKSACDDRTEL